MSYLAWLLLMALCGWIAGQVVGGKGRGAVADILLGITGALAVRFCFDVLRVAVPDAGALVFSFVEQQHYREHEPCHHI